MRGRADHRRQTHGSRERRRTAGANLVKLQGDFVWHQHEKKDELFPVLKGQMRIQFRKDVT